MRERPVQRRRMEVIHVPTVRLIPEGARERSAHEPLKEVGDVLTMAEASKCLILPTQAVAAV